MDEGKFWFSCLCAVLGTLLLIVVFCTFIFASYENKMAELGFQKTAVIGSSQLVYQKVGSN